MRASFSEGSIFGDNFSIRGYPVTATDIAFDGLYGLTNTRRPAIGNVEQVEILKGPSALLNGVPPSGAIGGTINLVPKRAADEPLTRIMPFFISQGQGGVAVDIGRRYGEAKEWGIRLNGRYRNGETAVDHERVEMGFGSLALDYRGERVRWSFDLSYDTYDGDQVRSLFTVAPGIVVPRSPKLSINQNQPFEFFRSTHLAAATRLEVDLSDNVTLFGAFGASSYSESGLAGFQHIVSAGGDYGGPVFRQAFDLPNYTGEAGIRARFETGFLSHRLTVSAAAFQTGYEYTRPSQDFLLGSSNLYNPVLLPAPRYLDPRFDARMSLQVNRGVTFADTISAFDERVQLTVGGRFQQILSKNFQTDPDRPGFGLATARYNNSAWSPAVALVVKPIEKLSVYGNYVEGLVSPGAAPLGTSNAGQVLPAIVADQKEVGVKYDFGSFGASAALFEINRPSAGVTLVGTDTNGTPISVFGLNGMQRNRGIELNVFGQPIEGVRLLGGVAFTEGRLVETDHPWTRGKTAQGVPVTTVNLYGEYDLPPWLLPGLTATGRLIYTSSQYVDLYNTQKIPDWTRFDAGLRYTFVGSWGKPVTLRANVENVFGANYWSSAFQGYLSQGRPRTYLLSAQLDF